MICLSCKEEMKGDPPLECPGCGFEHQGRPPVVGINHISQLLSAIDLLNDDLVSFEDFEVIYTNYVEQLDELEQKWQLRESSLSERLSTGLKDKFGAYFEQLDEALQAGYQGAEWIDAFLAEETDSLEQAEECVITFFRGVCAASAGILDRLDDFDQNKGSGMLFNLPSV